MRQKRAEIRNRILHVALTAFLERGFRNTTTREISHAAGVSYGNMYKYFASKDEILDELMGDFASMALRSSRAFLDHEHPDGRPSAEHGGLVEGLTSLYRADRSRMIVFFSRMDGANLDAKRVEMVEAIEQHTERYVRRRLMARILTRNLIHALVTIAKECPTAEEFHEELAVYVAYHFAGVERIR